MTEFLSPVNSFFGKPSTENLPHLAVMLKTADPKRVGIRLRAVQRHLGLRTVEEFAKRIGSERNQASGWLNGYNLPPVPYATVLLNDPEMQGANLDWIYFGIADNVPMKLAVKLIALEEEELAARVPVVAPEPGPGETAESAPMAAVRPKASRKKAT